MELVLNTPRQRWIYRNFWPHPGARFGNEWADAQRREKLRWLNRTWAQSTGFSPPAVSENWKETAPWVRDEAERIEAENRKRGIDKKFLPSDFIDLPEVVAETGDTGAFGTFGSLKTDHSRLEKYIVTVLGIIAAILILKMIL